MLFGQKWNVDWPGPLNRFHNSKKENLLCIFDFFFFASPKQEIISSNEKKVSHIYPEEKTWFFYIEQIFTAAAESKVN